MNFHWLTICTFAAVAFLPTTQAKPDELRKAPTPLADPMRGKEAGDVRDDNGLKMKLIWCPPGAFTMEEIDGFEILSTKDDEAGKIETRVKFKITPVRVSVTRGYWLGRFEVTQSEWKQVMATDPWKGEEFPRIGADFPATFVSWDDAMEFCRKFSERERMAGRVPDGWEYTLPTEAQWERACRAQTESKFSFGDDESKLAEYAWFRENAWDAGEGYAHRVGQKKPNPWGMYDMHGNVFEWCRDAYADKLPGGSDPEVTVKGAVRISRGGCLLSDASLCASAIRGRHGAAAQLHILGFRVTLTLVR